MKPVAWMVGVSLGSWLAAAALLDASAGTAAFLGMLGPLAVAIASWLLAERTYRSNPEGLTGLMMASFAGKIVFFGAYVTVMIKGLSQPVVPFVVSLTVSFITLHVIEALALRRLFAS